MLFDYLMSRAFPRYFQLLLLSGAFIVIFPHITQAANTWQEPTCDPTVSPSTCNISPPLNVSSAVQTKTGGLILGGSVVSPSIGLVVSNGFTLSSGTLTLPSNSVTDAFVSDTLTSTIYKRDSDGFTPTGVATSDAIDLSSWNASSAAGVELIGYLPTSAVTDNWVNTNLTTTEAMSGPLSITLANSSQAASNGLTITPYGGGSASTANALRIVGSSTQPLVYLQSSNNTSISEGSVIGVTVDSLSASSGLNITSTAGAAAAYPISVTLNNASTATRAISVSNVSTAANGYGLYASASGAATSIGVYGYGLSNGVKGESSGSHGVYGSATAAAQAGVYGTNTTSTTGYGVWGYGYERGVYGTTSNGYGVYGTVGGSLSSKAGVYGSSTSSSSSYGVQGNATVGYGGYFTGPTGATGISTTGTGVYGEGSTYGVRGKTSGGSYPGVQGEGSIYGVRGIGNYGVYGESTTYYGGYFTGPTGLQAFGSNGNGLESYSNTASKAGVYAESTAAGYGVYGRTTGTSNTIGAVTGYNTGTSGYSNGGLFYGQIGVTGDSTGTDQYAYGVNGITDAAGAPALHGYHNGASAGYGVWGEATTGIGVYGKGKTYAAKFDGTVIASNYTKTEQPASQLGSNMISSAGTYAAPTAYYLRNMVYDGSELWLLHNNYASGQQDYVYRYDPSTLFETRKYFTAASPDTYGVMSKMVAIPGAVNGRSVYYWDGAGNAYYYGKYDLNPTQANPSGTVKQNVTAGIYRGSTYTTNPSSKIIVGTCNNYGTTGTCTSGGGTLAYTDFGAGSYTNITYTGTIGGITDFVSDKDQRVYALSDRTSTNDEILRIATGLGSVSDHYTLPYDAAQTAKDMLYDGRYIWVLMDRSGAESIVRVDPDDTASVTEYYLTSDGTSTGTNECTSPIAMVYDDVYIWIGCTTLQSGYPGMIVFSPTEADIASYGGNAYIEFSGSQTMRGEPVYDGTYIYVVTAFSSTSRLRKYYSGHGPGSQTSPMVMGLNIVGTDGDGITTLYCMKVQGAAWNFTTGKCNGTISGFSY